MARSPKTELEAEEGAPAAETASAPKAKAKSSARKAPNLNRRARDARTIRSKAAILDAATELFVERGYAGFSVNALVRQAGIGKTTIYRHWATQNELLIAVLAEFRRMVSVPDTGSLRGDLVQHFMRQIHASNARDPKGTLKSLPSLIQAARQNYELAEIVNFSIETVLQSLRIILERAKARNELREDIDLDTMISVVFGTMSVQRTLHQELSDPKIVQIVDAVLGGLSPRP